MCDKYIWKLLVIDKTELRLNNLGKYIEKFDKTEKFIEKFDKTEIRLNNLEKMSKTYPDVQKVIEQFDKTELRLNNLEKVTNNLLNDKLFEDKRNKPNSYSDFLYNELMTFCYGHSTKIDLDIV